MCDIVGCITFLTVYVLIYPIIGYIQAITLLKCQITGSVMSTRALTRSIITVITGYIVLLG